eukprot:2859001-Pyramimonas_sp.AAC.1
MYRIHEAKFAVAGVSSGDGSYWNGAKGGPPVMPECGCCVVQECGAGDHSGMCPGCLRPWMMPHLRRVA